MSKIQSEADVLQWAEGMVAANGDKFTPLSKGEQFIIAKYIYDRRDTIGEEQREVVPPCGADTPQTEVTDKTIPEEPNEKPQNADNPTIKMSRGAAFHLAGLTAQNSYDEYLKWIKDHPQEKEVMDFSTGRKSEAAAYSYWLSEIINVHFTDKK